MSTEAVTNVTSNRNSEPLAASARAAMRRWEDLIPWFLTIASTITLACIAWFLVENVLWFRASALAPTDLVRPTYRLHIYHLHIAMIKRSVGLFSGFALLFLGTGVVFYTLRSTSTVNLATESLSTSIASASPGIIGMALGVLLLLGTIASKDDFPLYQGETAPISKDVPTEYVPYSQKEAQ